MSGIEDKTPIFICKHCNSVYYSLKLVEFFGDKLLGMFTISNGEPDLELFKKDMKIRDIIKNASIVCDVCLAETSFDEPEVENVLRFIISAIDRYESMKKWEV